MEYPVAFSRVFERLRIARQSGDTWYAHCPAHEDTNPSLTLKVGANGKLLAKCHRANGCSLREIASACGLTEGDFMPATESKRRIVETYDYTDESGKLLYQVVRYEPKDFRQRKPDGHGGWDWKLGATRRVLFNLPALAKNQRCKSPRTVIVAEGEKDAIALGRINLLATTNAGGAEKWRDEYCGVLTGVPVVVLRDNDAAGKAHQEMVVKSLTGTASSVIAVELPGLGDKEDVSDWIARGGTRAALIELATGKTPAANPAEQMVEYAEKLLELARKAAGR